MKKDYITVIIPVYNVEKYLNKCIESILNQTYKNIKIILIDDGSTDSSGVICDQYMKEHNNIIVIHKKNEGAGLTRNVGLDIADSRYIAFVDADDYIDKDMYKNLYENLVKNKAQACFCGAKKIYENKKECINKKVNNLILNRSEILNRSIPYICSGEISEPILYGAVALWHGLYDLKIIKEHNIKFLSEREYTSEDTIFNLNYFIYCDKIVFIEQYLYYQNITKNSVSRAYNKEETKKFKNFYEKVYNFIIYNKIPNPRKNILLLNRRYINLYKHAIAKEIKLNYDIKSAYRNIKDECENDSILKNIIKNKEYYQLSIKEKIFIFAIKYRIYIILKIIFKK